MIENIYVSGTNDCTLGTAEQAEPDWLRNMIDKTSKMVDHLVMLYSKHWREQSVLSETKSP